MRLLVYEHVSGGGFADESLPATMLSEGFSMLRTLVSDFKAAGYQVSTTLDSRVAGLNPPIPADCVVPVISSRDTQVKICELSEQNDAVYVIAPETDGVLQSLVEMVKQTRAASLNCQVAAIEKVSDKAGFIKFIKTLGVPIPETKLFSITDGLEENMKAVRNSLSFPVVFKPSDGASCGGISVVKNEAQLAGAVGKIKSESSDKQFMVQELIKGSASSVSLLCRSASRHQRSAASRSPRFAQVCPNNT